MSALNALIPCVLLLCLVTQLSCQYVASPPGNVKGTNTSAQSILVQWNPVPISSANGTMLGYRVFYKENGSNSVETSSDATGADTSRLEISGLLPYRLYRVQVAARTNLGIGERSDVILVTTDEAVPSEIPRITLCESRTPTSIYLEWDPISPDNVNGVLLGYRIYYLRAVDIPDYMNKYRKISVLQDRTNATITDVLPFTEYLVGVAALNSKGVDLTPGTIQHVKRIWTGQAAPSSPEGLRAVFTSDTTLRADWLAISRDDANGILHGYEYRLYINTTRIGIRNGTVSNTTTSYEFSALERCAEYAVSVRGWTAGGYGNYSTVTLPYECGIPVIYNPDVTVTGSVSKPVVLPLNYTSIPSATSIVWTLPTGHDLTRNHEMHGVVQDTETGEFIRTVTLNNETLYISLLTYKEVGKYHVNVTNRFGSAVATRTLITSEDTVQVSFLLTLTNEQYSEELRSKKSPRYLSLERRLKRAVASLYSSKTSYSILDVIVNSFRNGSVLASFQILAKLVGTIDATTQSQAKQDILVTMVTSARSGKVSGLAVSAVIIQGPPPAVKNLAYSDVHTSFTRISWTVPEFSEEYQMIGYSLQYRKHGKPFGTVESVGASVDRGIVKGLEPNNNYYIRVLSHRSGNKETGKSKELEISTEDGMVKEALLVIGLPVAIIILFLVVFVLVFRPRCSTTDAELNEEELRIAGGDVRMFGPPTENIYDISRYLEEFPCEWDEIPREDVETGKELGAGAFGQVMAGFVTKGDKKIHCAIKMLKRHAGERDYRDLFNELSIMAQFGNHRNVVNLLGACTQNGPLWVIVSLAENGSLIDYLHEHRKPDYADHSYQNVPSNNPSNQQEEISYPQKLKFAHGIAKGMCHLEKHKCVHRDLAARNILLGRNLEPMVSDFGLSRDIYECGLYEDFRGGKRPVRWMAPESLEDYTCTSKSDVWSYGIVLWEIETAGTVPYAGIESSLEILKEIKRGYRLEQPPGCDDKIYALMLDTWEANPLNRPSFEVIVQRVEAILGDEMGYLEIQHDDEAASAYLNPYDEVHISDSQLDLANGVVQTGGYHGNDAHVDSDDVRDSSDIERIGTAHAQADGIANESRDTSRDSRDMTEADDMDTKC